MLSAFIDLLVEQELAAIVWAKLPRGDVWQAELERYSLETATARSIYLFRNQRDEAADEAGMVSSFAPAAAPDPAESGVTEGDRSLLANQTTILPIQLAPDSPLRREYFLVVWTAQFQGVILAHRPRSANLAKANAASPAEPKAPDSSGPEDNPDRRQPLLAICSFDSGLIQRVLQGLEQTTQQPRVAIGNEGSEFPLSLSPADVIGRWQTQLNELPISGCDLGLLGQLFTRQLTRQEELWQRSATYRKQAEQAEILQQQNEELLNTLRLKDDFLNNVGQELRTPLTTIKTALSLLNSPTIKLPQRQRYMELIAKECDRQSSLITSLLDLVQLDQVVAPASLQPLRLSEVVPGVVSTYQPLAEEKGVMLAYTVPEDLPAVACMGNWLRQIVINLLHNGIKFTPRGGQVWVRAKQLDNFVQLEFRDTGIGIATGEIPKIFERFYRVRQAAEDTNGSGLGLTIVQQLLIHCGGSISVKSKLGEGSTFNVLLPIYKAGEPEPSA